MAHSEVAENYVAAVLEIDHLCIARCDLEVCPFFGCALYEEVLEAYQDEALAVVLIIIIHSLLAVAAVVLKELSLVYQLIDGFCELQGLGMWDDDVAVALEGLDKLLGSLDGDFLGFFCLEVVTVVAEEGVGFVRKRKE